MRPVVGKPVIKGTRLTVDFILNQLAHCATEAEILFMVVTEDTVRIAKRR